MKVKVSLSPNLSESQELDLSLAAQRGKEWTIGRSPDSDLVLDSGDVSRLHGKFFFQGGNYYFCDLGSRNGSTVNGKLAEKNHAYILRDRDIIRIGDFILTIEEILAFSQQAETVVRIISPSQFSNWRSTENADNVSVENPTPEVVSQVPEKVGNESPDLRTPVAEELGQTPREAQSPEIVNAADLELDDVWSDVTLVQGYDTVIQAESITTPESSIQPNVTASVASEVISTPADEQVRAEVGQAEPAEILSGVIPEIGEHSDFTYIQTRDIIDEFPEERTIPQMTSQSASVVREISEVVIEETVNISTSSTEEEATGAVNSVTLEVEELLDYTIVQPRDIIEQFPEAKTTPESTTEPASQESEAPEVVSSVASQQSEDLDLNNIESLETTAAEIDAVSTQVLEEQKEEEPVSEVTTISESESLSEAPSLSSQAIEEVPETESEHLGEISDTGDSEYPESLREKRIVLIAHETKKSELADFVNEHHKFFSLCHTIAWSSVSEVLNQQVGITISEQIPPATSGGYQTIASLVGSGNISAVIFLRDFLQPQPGKANEDAMLTLCNINQVLLATNVVTAKAIVHYIKHQ
ncbi:MAG: FHA domain-containing protein [Stigonema ocellatum SAG 48.90 = DSM 106950]|nr:FHA domain-containing protein [Stigonema ocellatum SAG 48.90 = DSM 106950]